MPDSSFPERRAAVLHLINSHPAGLTRQDIVTRTGIGGNYCSNVLAKLREEGAVESIWREDGLAIWRTPSGQGRPDWFPEARFDRPGMVLTRAELIAENAIRPRQAADVTAALMGDPVRRRA